MRPYRADCPRGNRWPHSHSCPSWRSPLGCGEKEEPPAPADPAAAERASRFDERRAFADLEAQVRIGPRPAGSAANRRLTGMLAARLREAGVNGVRVQRPHRNVVGAIPGREPGAIVIGAHHDTKAGVPGFVGANDGASGVAVVLELARALPARLDGPSIHIALFDAEEARGPAVHGGRDAGSGQYVRYASAGGGRGHPGSTTSGTWCCSISSATAISRSPGSRTPTRRSTSASTTRRSSSTRKGRRAVRRRDRPDPRRPHPVR